MLNREAILAADDLPREKVHVKEWGGDVFVQTLASGDKDRWELYVTSNDRKNVRASLVAFTACDEQGNLLFAETDIEAIAKKSGVAVGKVADVALRLNKVDGEVAELEKGGA